MCYVAGDPQQPGAAWAICLDDGKYPDDVAETVSDWIRRGANVQRMDVDAGREMLMRWVRPEVSQ